MLLTVISPLWFPAHASMAIVQSVSVIYLVRHGQACFGTDDYDRLSDRGLQQSRTLGEQLRRRGIVPDRIVTGSMLRQVQTAQAACGMADWTAPLQVDPGWDEFNASELIAALPDPDPGHRTDSRAFQRTLEAAAHRWQSGQFDDEYPESYQCFANRVDTALRTALDGLGQGQSALVVSSSGAIAWTAAQLLSGGFEQWLRLNRVTVNSGVSKIVGGRQGTTLISYNDHTHLPSDWVTYR